MATDIAARGVHVDDVELVVHVDPPVEHKAYLHRSGRTARAGNAGDVVTVVLPEQRREVQVMMRSAGITVDPQQVAADSAPVPRWSAISRRTKLPRCWLTGPPNRQRRSRVTLAVAVRQVPVAVVAEPGAPVQHTRAQRTRETAAPEAASDVLQLELSTGIALGEFWARAARTIASAVWNADVTWCA